LHLNFHSQLAENYASGSQKARILTENWIQDNMYCPVCGHCSVTHFQNNRAVADFYCPACNEQYELKSKHGSIGSKVIDGAYKTFIERITSNQNPHFFFMEYSLATMTVLNLKLIPKFFFWPAIVEKRPPLPPTARRSGWIGCNILLSQIPSQGKIEVIQEGNIIDKNVVLEKIKQAYRIREDDVTQRGWLFDILYCLDQISEQTFTLNTMYQFDRLLEERHPQNHHIRAKIRQQLQVLRDKGLIEFMGNGHYKKI